MASVSRNVFVTGTRSRGTSKNNWKECIEQDTKLCGLTKEAALDKNA